MSKQKMRIPPALRHGCYSGLGLLPTEDPVAFEKMRRDIIAEYRPSGRSEEIVVRNLADFMWRRENLVTYRLAHHARSREYVIYSVLQPRSLLDTNLGFEPETRGPEELKALRDEADQRAQRELAPVQELIDIGKAATPDELLKDLELFDRLDAAIARCLKQLLLMRGVKSISASS
jgi:hypothetical protein